MRCADEQAATSFIERGGEIKSSLALGSNREWKDGHCSAVVQCPLDLLKWHRDEFNIKTHSRGCGANNLHAEAHRLAVLDIRDRRKVHLMRNAHRCHHEREHLALTTCQDEIGRPGTVCSVQRNNMRRNIDSAGEYQLKGVEDNLQRCRFGNEPTGS